MTVGAGRHSCGAALLGDVGEGQSALAGADMACAHGQVPQVLRRPTPAGALNMEHDTNPLQGKLLRWEGPPQATSRTMALELDAV